MKHFLARLLFLTLSCFLTYEISAQVIPNGTIDNIEELRVKDTVYTKTSDGTLLATEVYVPVFRDSVVTNITLNGTTYPIQIIKKNSQFIIYDTTDISANNFSLPFVFTRTPYNKSGDDIGGDLFPFLGYGFAIQDMRGRYESEGVYFPMYSDAWSKYPYHPNISIPMDITNSTDPNNALHHHDGSQAVYDIADSIMRIADVNMDGIEDTITYCNGNMGMYGASALGNSQYQALSDIPFTNGNNPLQCLFPIVGTNEHYNTTLFHNGVYRNSLSNGWLTNQMTTGVYDTLVGTDTSILNNLHSPADYNYTNSNVLANDLIDWYVSDSHGTSPSGAHPTSVLRKDLDASMAPVDATGNSAAGGSMSRYKNLNKPIYHLTGWWDIFINGQIETFNKTRSENPGTRQKLVIGPWTHQTIGTNNVGDVTYPDNVYDVLNIDMDIDPDSLFSGNGFLNKLYTSEILAWFRSHLGGEPYFIIPESQYWQNVNGDLVRVPSENYIIPYYKFLNYLGGLSTLPDIPIEVNSGGNLNTYYYDLPILSPALLNLSQPVSAVDTTQFDNVADARMYITGPTNDPGNPGVGNYWMGSDSLPFRRGITEKKIFLHQNALADSIAPTQNEGTLSYTADPGNPVITVGGNNMIPNVPNGNQDSQGSMDLANTSYDTLTMNRSDVLAFETAPLSDTMRVVGFPKAGFYAKAQTTTHNTTKTDFDIMVRVVDVYPDGREMFITEGVVNAKSREYARSIMEQDTNETLLLTNIDNNTYHYFEFNLLPMGHTFGAGHRIKFLVSSSNYPKYQSNPHIPNESGEFFRWSPGETTTYNYQGMNLSAQNADIMFEFNPAFPTYVTLPQFNDPTLNIAKAGEKRNYVSVYPNPAIDQVSVRLSESYNGAIEIYTMSGQQVYAENPNHTSRQFTIDISTLSRGVYVVKLPDIQAVQKLVVQ